MAATALVLDDFTAAAHSPLVGAIRFALQPNGASALRLMPRHVFGTMHFQPLQRMRCCSMLRTQPHGVCGCSTSHR